MASPKMPRAVRATTDDIGEGRYPKALLVACLSWVLLGVLLLLSRIGAPVSTDAEETNAATGVTAVRAPTPWFVDLLPWLGVLVLVVAVLLFLGQAWARLALALLGLLAVVGLALAATWLAIPGAVLFVLGATCSVLVSVHRYLTRPRTGPEPADPSTTRVVS